MREVRPARGGTSMSLRCTDYSIGGGGARWAIRGFEG